MGRVNEAVQDNMTGKSLLGLESGMVKIDGNPCRLQSVSEYKFIYARTPRVELSTPTHIRMNMLGSAFLALVGVIGVQAQPLSVTLAPVNDCAALPKWNKATNIAGPWTIRVDGCRNGTSPRGDCSIEGFTASCDVTRSADETGIEKGSIVISNRPQNVKTQLRCNGALQTVEALVPSGAGALDWHAVAIDTNPSTGEIEWGMGTKDTQPVQVYRQYVHGSPVNGLFLGSKGQTNWVVHHSGLGLSNVDRMPFWFLRLLNKDSELWSGEFETSIRIDGS